MASLFSLHIFSKDSVQYSCVFLLSIFTAGLLVVIDSPFADLAVFGGVCFLAISFARPMAGFIFYLFMIQHEQVVDLKVANVMIINLMLASVVLSTVFNSVSARSFTQLVLSIKKPLALCSCFIVTLLLVSLFNSTEKYSSVALYCFRMVSLLTLFYYFVDSRARLELALKVLLLSGVCMALFGLFEVLIGRTFFYSAWTLGERYRFGIVRMGSTVGDPNYVCMALLPLIPLAHYFYSSAKTFIAKGYYLSILAIFTLTIALTFSRIGCLALFFYGVYSLYAKYARGLETHYVIKKVLFLVVVSLLSVVLYFGYSLLTAKISGAQISSTTRAIALELSYHFFKQFPLTGVGFDRLEYFNGSHLKTTLTASGGISSMNTYLKILAEDGVFVFISFFGLVAYAIRKLQKLGKTDPIYHYLNLGFISWLMVAVTLDSMGTAVFWIIIATVLRDYHEPATAALPPQHARVSLSAGR